MTPGTGANEGLWGAGKTGLGSWHCVTQDKWLSLSEVEDKGTVSLTGLREDHVS